MTIARPLVRVPAGRPFGGPPAAAAGGDPTRADETFRALGTTCRIVVEADGTGEAADAAVARCRRFLEGAEARLSRFRPDSDLVRLNASPETTVAVDPLLLDALGAGLDAASRTGGLLDPAVLPALERLGYARSRAGTDRTGVLAALRDAPPRRPAGPDPDAAWRAVTLDPRTGTVTRPPGLRLDVGATAKGWLADRCAARLHPHARWAIDLGGDLRVGGHRARTRPFVVEVAAPLGAGPVARVALSSGAIATSGIDRRLWRRADGRPAHHVVDPATGEPAWTGVLTATAVASSAEEAELRASAVLLGGPAFADGLATDGGVAILDTGRVLRRPTDRAGSWRWSA